MGRGAESFPAADEDYFRDMDYGATKDPKQIAAALAPYVPGIAPDAAVSAVVKGRNNWIVWSGGNDRLWDVLSVQSAGILDFLKILSNHPSLDYSRDTRWRYLGLVNEPCFEKGSGPRKDRYGLWLDVRRDDCPADPFENEAKYPGVKIGARGKNMPVGSYYGYATGIVGLRLLPNPDFDEAAAKRWDPERYYTDPSYYNDKNLVKPYRVGMSCGFCHVGPNPSNPPKDPEHPKWENLNSNPGAQYFWVDRIFVWKVDESSFAYQLFHTSRPGALDTSFVSTDYMNNPRTMNSVYNLGARMAIARQWGEEKLAGGELDNEHLNRFVPPGSPLPRFYQAPNTVWTPRVLKDGSDSVGALGALESRLRQHRAVQRGMAGAFPAVRRRHKVHAVRDRGRAKEFELLERHRGPDAGRRAVLSRNGQTRLSEGCARRPRVPFRGRGGTGTREGGVCRALCSLPLEQAAGAGFSIFSRRSCAGPNYLKCWNDYWAWTKTGEFKSAMTAIALAESFLKR